MAMESIIDAGGKEGDFPCKFMKIFTYLDVLCFPDFGFVETRKVLVIKI